MRTLFLLATLLLLTLQAQAQTLQETADQVPAQDQLWDKGQDEDGDSDQDVAISLTEEERLVRATGRGKTTICYCTTKNFCNFPEKKAGCCRLYGRRHTLCCH